MNMAKAVGAGIVAASPAAVFDGIEAVNPYIEANYTQSNYEKVGDFTLNTTVGANKTISINPSHALVLDANAAWQNAGTPGESALTVGAGVGYILRTGDGNERASISAAVSTPAIQDKKKSEFPTQISITGRMNLGK
jgi:hypothetical protein